MCIDFHTGLAVDSINIDFKTYQLPCNKKGHYVRDIVLFDSGLFKSTWQTQHLDPRGGCAVVRVASA